MAMTPEAPETLNDQIGAEDAEAAQLDAYARQAVRIPSDERDVLDASVSKEDEVPSPPSCLGQTPPRHSSRPQLTLRCPAPGTRAVGVSAALNDNGQHGRAALVAHKKDESASVWEVLACVCVWYVAAIAHVFVSKNVLRFFQYAFMLISGTNAVVAVISFALTRLPVLRQPPISLHTLTTVAVPIALATTLDTSFSAWSLRYVSVAFHVMLKGTIPLFVLLFGLLLRLERPSWKTPLAVVLIGVGMVLVSCDRLTLPNRVLGVVLGLVSSAFTGLRWALTQLLIGGRGWPCGRDAALRSPFDKRSADESLSRTANSVVAADADATSTSEHVRAELVASSRQLSHEGDATAKDSMVLSRRMNPLAALLYLSPITAVGAFACVPIFEQDVVRAEALSSRSGVLELCMFLALLGTLVFVLQMAEYWLVRLTSSLTLSIFNILKEVLTVLLSVALFGDALSWLNVVGLACCIGGAAIYHSKKRKKQAQAQAQAWSVDLRIPGAHQAGLDKAVSAHEEVPGSFKSLLRGVSRQTSIADDVEMPPVTTRNQ